MVTFRAHRRDLWSSRSKYSWRCYGRFDRVGLDGSSDDVATLCGETAGRKPEKSEKQQIVFVAGFPECEEIDERDLLANSIG